jgi:serine protease Do
MPAKKKIVAASLFVVIGVIIGLMISSNFNFFSNGYTQETIPKESVDLLTKINKATEDVVKATKPAVVNITSTKTVHMQGVQSPFSNDPFFREFFGNRFRQFETPKDFKQSGVGSGVIVDRDGYILTNNHVIQDADEIKVRVSDKETYKGKVIGTDPKTDLAVIKISASGLPVIKLGDSDQLKVGDMVIAIGNPLGLNQTVTTGIISATGRANVGIADYEDFIQTDAAINPGNSGGALVNARGELIGINTAIFSTSGGYQGIGFAIPSNMAKTVMEKLIRHGKVVRGWLGVAIQPITPDLAKELGLKSDKGALIADVTEGGPAEKAGLKTGDVITELNGKPVDDVRELRNMIADVTPGKEVTIGYVRGGQSRTLQVVIQELPAKIHQAAAGKTARQFAGVSVQNLTPDIRNSLSLPPRVNGVVVSQVYPGSPAGQVLAQGDVIMEVNRTKVRNVAEYQAAISGVKPGQSVLLLIYRNGSSLFVTLKQQSE